MATTWPGSRIPYIDADGTPMVGAKLRFYNAGTSTPQAVYADGALSVARDQPILADARGMFPAIYLNPTPGLYRQKLTEANDTLVFDDDDIDVPQAASYVPPDPGTTDPTLLVTTGMRIGYFGTAAPAGWVRAAGRTLGSAASGATERANTDCQALFLHLWTADATLTVSGGRGASAAGDWAANKTIALPDYRDRTAAGLATMGNADAGLIDNAFVDAGESSSVLGATAGLDDVALLKANLPSVTLGGTAASAGSHGHPTYVSTDNGDADGFGGIMLRAFGNSVFTAHDNVTPDGDAGDQIGMAGAHTHTITTDALGSDTAHNNIQPTIFELVIIKL